ncbi:MAG: hypothetical protein AAF602_31405, partial [Myxococcota bacterium]
RVRARRARLEHYEGETERAHRTLAEAEALVDGFEDLPASRLRRELARARRQIGAREDGSPG